jgi:histidinol-phosphatase (PHP family)
VPEPLLYESHLHTPLCRHAVGEPEEYAAEAGRKNLRGIIVTCHNPIPNGYSANVRMRENQFDEYVAMVARARAAWTGRVDVRLGIECDFAPGLEPDVANLLQRAEFHYVLGSVHTQVKEYRARYETGTAFEYQKTYFHHLALAAETGLFDSLSHPDLVKNQAPHEWNLSRLLPDIQRALDRIAATGIAMELNTSGLHKSLPEMNPGPEILAQMRQRGIPVVLGADAHIPPRVGADYPLALRMLLSAGYENVSFFLNRQRQEISISAALSSLSPI